MAKIKKITVEWDNGDKRTFQEDGEEVLSSKKLKQSRRLITEHIGESEEE